MAQRERGTKAARKPTSRSQPAGRKRSPKPARQEGPRSNRRPSAAPTVVNLLEARTALRVREYANRIDTVIGLNKNALNQLVQTGVVFSRPGARLGRDLLAAHQNLLKVKDLLLQLTRLTREEIARTHRVEAESVYQQMQGLLVKTHRLTTRSDGLLARR